MMPVKSANVLLVSSDQCMPSLAEYASGQPGWKVMRSLSRRELLQQLRLTDAQVAVVEVASRRDPNLELLVLLNEHWGQAIVVVVAMDSDPDLEVAAHDAHVDCFLGGRCDPAEVVSMVNSLLSGKRRARANPPAHARPARTSL